MRRSKIIILSILFSFLILILILNHQILPQPLSLFWGLGTYQISSPSIAYFFFTIYGLIIGVCIER